MTAPFLASPDLAERLARIADALERIAPPPRRRPDFAAADAFVWRADSGALEPVAKVNRVDISLLHGVDRVRNLLIDNTLRFARGLPANNALLWGARGMGKSSLVKAAHAEINRRGDWRRPAEAGRDPPRGHREPAGADGAHARRAAPLHRLLRRSLFRRRRHVVQVAEGGARRRHRGAARQRRLLRHLQSPPPDAARDDGERALERNQSRRSGRGEGVAVGSLRPVARLPPLQPGRVSRHGARLRRLFRPRRAARRRSNATRSNGRRRAAPAPAAPLGSSPRISPAGLAAGSTAKAEQRQGGGPFLGPAAWS